MEFNIQDVYMFLAMLVSFGIGYLLGFKRGAKTIQKLLQTLIPENMYFFEVGVETERKHPFEASVRE